MYAGLRNSRSVYAGLRGDTHGARPLDAIFPATNSHRYFGACAWRQSARKGLLDPVPLRGFSDWRRSVATIFQSAFHLLTTSITLRMRLVFSVHSL